MANKIYVLKNDEEQVEAYFSTEESANRFANAAKRSIYEIEEIDLDHSETDDGKFTFTVVGNKPAKNCEWHSEPWVHCWARIMLYARPVPTPPEVKFGYDSREEVDGSLRVNCLVNATCSEEAIFVARPYIEKFVAEYEANKAKP